jgi:dsRNA-specific ribonuclease
MDNLIFEDSDPDSNIHPSNTYASPLPEKALHSAKLAALHSRLSLPRKLPLQTMARTLVDPSADSNPNFNNAAMSQLGGSLISYYVAEYLLCTYPRLPISVLFAATYAYNGPKTLQIIAKEWGVETAAAPGDEVDPGLLQFGKLKPGTKVDKLAGGGGIRPGYKNWRKSGTLVYDDEFGDAIPAEQTETDPLPTETAYSNFVKAVVGSLYLHAGREAAKNFVKQHILSRHLAISSLFQFREPIKELSRLCAREEFEYPVARLLSETGRMSRTPVFVVGIYSGTDKLGEGAGASLPEARIRASVAALKAWYLYSPGKNVTVPSDMEDPNAKEWEPVHIDIGEIIS